MIFQWFDRADHRYPMMRQPDRQPRCYDLTEDERLQRVREWNGRNVWNTPDLAQQDMDNYYGA